MKTIKLALLLMLIASLCTAQTEVPGDYPEASTQELTDEDLERYNEWELSLVRNEIFARYGYIFKKAELREHFTAQDWYKPRFADVTSKLTEIEKRNIQLLMAREKWLQPVPVKKLPLLNLPFNLLVGSSVDFNQVKGISPKSSRGTPDAFVGLLPDTSKYYAVLWYTNELSIAGASPVMYHITTYTKKLKEITTVTISFTIGDTEKIGGTDCENTNYEHSSYINDDLSYLSEYTFMAKCPEDREPQPTGYKISGQIKPDGTIVVLVYNSPF